eukprot:2810624-Amphidinium_carterae.1
MGSLHGFFGQKLSKSVVTEMVSVTVASIRRAFGIVGGIDAVGVLSEGVHPLAFSGVWTTGPERTMAHESFL